MDNRPELELIPVQKEDDTFWKKTMETYHRLNTKLDELLVTIELRKAKKNK